MYKRQGEFQQAVNHQQQQGRNANAFAQLQGAVANQIRQAVLTVSQDAAQAHANQSSRNVDLNGEIGSARSQGTSSGTRAADLARESGLYSTELHGNAHIAAEASLEYSGLVLSVLMSPLTGTLDAAAGIHGTSLTGEKLSPFERLVNVVSVIPVGELAEQSLRLGKRGISGGTVSGRAKSHSDWFPFWYDRGGYTRAFKVADRKLIGPKYLPGTIINDKLGTTAYLDTKAHEAVHRFVIRHLPFFHDLGNLRIANVPIGAPVKYIEEVVAYGVGHARAGRIHGLGFNVVEPLLSESLTAGEKAVTWFVIFAGAWGVYEYTN